MTKFMLALSLPLAFALGCGDTNEPADNTPDNGGGVGNDTGPGGDTGTVLSGMVVATAPEGLSGDFFFGDDLLCGGASSCEANVEGAITIRLQCVGKAFFEKSAVGDPDKVIEVTWTSAEWGLAPSGTYSKEDGDEHAVKTTVEDVGGQQHVLLWEDEDVIGIVEGNTFSWTSESGTQYSGTISDDLKTIVYHIVAKNGNEKEVILTLVE